jgi:hypothetical protein
VKCIQYGICVQASFKNEGATFFLEVEWDEQHFLGGIKNKIFKYDGVMAWQSMAHAI